MLEPTDKRFEVIHQVVELALSGKSDKEIADSMNLTIQNVANIRIGAGVQRRVVKDIFKEQAKNMTWGEKDSNPRCNFAIPLKYLKQLGIDAGKKYSFLGEITSEHELKLTFSEV